MTKQEVAIGTLTNDSTHEDFNFDRGDIVEYIYVGSELRMEDKRGHSLARRFVISRVNRKSLRSIGGYAEEHPFDAANWRRGKMERVVIMVRKVGELGEFLTDRNYFETPGPWVHAEEGIVA